MLIVSRADGFPPMPRTVSRSWDHWSPPSSPGPHLTQPSNFPRRRSRTAALGGCHWWGEELFAGDLAVAGCVQANFSPLESLTGHRSH